MKPLWRIVLALTWGIAFALGVIHIDWSLFWLFTFAVFMVILGCVIVALDKADEMPDDYDRNLY